MARFLMLVIERQCSDIALRCFPDFQKLIICRRIVVRWQRSRKKLVPFLKSVNHRYRLLLRKKS